MHEFLLAQHGMYSPSLRVLFSLFPLVSFLNTREYLPPLVKRDPYKFIAKGMFLVRKKIIAGIPSCVIYWSSLENDLAGFAGLCQASMSRRPQLEVQARGLRLHFVA